MTTRKNTRAKHGMRSKAAPKVQRDPLGVMLRSQGVTRQQVGTVLCAVDGEHDLLPGAVDGKQLCARCRTWVEVSS